MTVGKHIFLELLHREGVGYIFGNPGTTEPLLWDDRARLAKLRAEYLSGLAGGVPVLIELIVDSAV